MREDSSSGIAVIDGVVLMVPELDVGTIIALFFQARFKLNTSKLWLLRVFPVCV
jgi:hypothetical protein